MTDLIAERATHFGDDYRRMLATLSEGSVHVHFDPYEDIAWDAPEMAVDPDDHRWILPDFDALGATQWYQDLPRERQIEVGRARTACAIKVGLEFENLLIRGLLQFATKLPNGSPEFRYCLHEMTEECNHIQMFQELVNRTGVDAPGLSPWLKVVMPLGIVVLGSQHIQLMVAILSGEEPIDHHQKALIRSGIPLPPVFKRVMEIHIAEEARHISFAAEFLRVRVPRMGRFQRALTGVLFPITMRIAGGEMMAMPKSIAKEVGVPRKVMKEAFFGSPASKQLMASYYGDMRALATETGLMNRLARRIWRLMGIDGEPSRYRGEPRREAELVD
jgi:hypothetical protein